LKVGDTLKQPELAATLKRIAKEWRPRVFTEGRRHALIVADMAEVRWI